MLRTLFMDRTLLLGFSVAVTSAHSWGPIEPGAYHWTRNRLASRHDASAAIPAGFSSGGRPVLESGVGDAVQLVATGAGPGLDRDAARPGRTPAAATGR
ncbi:hypothetical protein [Pseudonocardia adelaidensis]|uniref:Uncharacterized protein n=1 Tax=Pseudonocardia adelaidensis TaxID=648754 RepID=A0ABP9NHC3_9PSEU